MQKILLVAIGGAIGSIARFKLSELMVNQAIYWKFPLGTFTVNILGCLVIGALAGLADQCELFSPDWKLFLFTGLLGGFTTFSAFGLETMMLLRNGDMMTALLYVLLSVIIGIALMYGSFMIFRQLV